MKNFKKVVFYTDPFLGNYTIQDLIFFLENLYIRNKTFDDEVTKLLKSKNISNYKINKLLNISNTSYNLNFIINMLNNNL